jgi:hypothetical protein
MVGAGQGKQIENPSRVQTERQIMSSRGAGVVYRYKIAGLDIRS